MQRLIIVQIVRLLTVIPQNIQTQTEACMLFEDLAIPKEFMDRFLALVVRFRAHQAASSQDYKSVLERPLSSHELSITQHYHLNKNIKNQSELVFLL